MYAYFRIIFLVKFLQTIETLEPQAKNIFLCAVTTVSMDWNGLLQWQMCLEHHLLAPVLPVIPRAGASVKCNWTEHSSPHGYKYYQ